MFMKFRDYFSLKHIVIAVVILAVFVLFAVIDSDGQVKVYFEENTVSAVSDHYVLEIPYSQIASAELTLMAEAGREVENCVDDKIVRTGCWENDDWGEYFICADMDANNCIVIHLNDGRIFVFSRKNDAETEKLYQTLQTYL